MDGVRRVIVFVAAAVLAACSSGSDTGGERTSLARIETASGDVTLRVAVADTDGERARGLQGVTDLAADAGMAFQFDAPTRARFWMKDTPLPLSIAFWGADGRIVGVMDMPPCADDPCPTYRPDGSYVGALEANRGFFTEHGVRVGDRVAIER
jgi:uncharacterized membrane protein (UPF0127 family)